uniref:Uncharacterized protein n=2 Tax=Caenorhabditis japonica TaxID=281687 RepID=A0A8R1E2J1_CAEJA
MYPFNRTTSIRAENADVDVDADVIDEFDYDFECEGEEHDKIYTNLHTHCQMEDNPQPAQSDSPVEKTILAAILEMGNVNDKWAKALATTTNKKKKERRISFFECSWR